MIRKHASRTLRFLRTTAIGGIFFLLPLSVIGLLVGQLLPFIWSAAELVNVYIPKDTPGGYSILFLSGLAVVILICFAAGIVARWAFGRRLIAMVEKYLLMLFPRYAIFKEQLSGNIGGNQFQNTMKPVLFHCLDFDRIALEIERSDSLITLYLPGSPDPWSGTVVVAETEKVEPLDMDFGETLAVFEQLGRKTQQVMKTARMNP